MKKLFTFLCLLASTSIYAQTYSIEVETYVKGKIEDRFKFDMEVGTSQTKGFDGKYLAKRYRAAGYKHKLIEAQKAAELREEELKNQIQKTPDQVITEYLDRAETRLRSAGRSISALEGDTITLTEEVEYLKKVLENTKNNAQAPAYKDFEKKYKITKEDIEKKRKSFRRAHRGSDVEEIDIGSYCTFEILKAKDEYIQVNLDFAYSRVESSFYSDGNNNSNSITKFPIVERFEKLGIKELALACGKPYCIQFSRKSPKEMQSLAAALANTSVFGGKGGSSEVKEEKKSRYDTQGLYANIKKDFGSAASKVARVVITVKMEK